MRDSLQMVNDKRLLVVGSASRRGIGRAVCTMAARQGAQVLALDVGFADDAGFTETDMDGEIVQARQGDITDEASCRAVGEELRRMGGIDAIINCAGIVEPMAISDLDRHRFDRMIDVNLWGSALLAREWLPVLRADHGPSITYLSSSAAQRGGGVVGGLHYAASKAGVLGLVRGLARELGPLGIRVNAVAPGMVDTGMTDPFMSRETRDASARGIPLQRIARPDEIASVCLFLASDHASYITGATIDVNGGLHIH